MAVKAYQQKLLVIVLCAFLAMNYPLLLLASHENLVLGIPALYVYLFGLWLLLILIVRRLILRLQQPDSSAANLNDHA